MAYGYQFWQKLKSHPKTSTEVLKYRGNPGILCEAFYCFMCSRVIYGTLCQGSLSLLITQNRSFEDGLNIMPTSPAAMIKQIAENNGIELEGTSVDCLLFIYALTFKESETILKKKVEKISKRSINRIREALDTINIEFGYLKGEGKLKGRNCSDVEHIRPIIQAAVGHLDAAFNIHDDTKPDPQQRPEKLRLRREALRLCGEDLSACLGCISYINGKIGWWCKKEKERDCLNGQSAPPPRPTHIGKARGSKRKLA